MIAYRLQEQAFGGLDRQTAKMLDRLARGGKAATELNRRLKPGTVLLREYQGERHEVTVTPDGYIWRGATFPSLSAIAGAITRTSWNGRRFFGVLGRAEKYADDREFGQDEGTGCTPATAGWDKERRGVLLDGDAAMKPSLPKMLRCAIYTRKSTEHNLDLAFNSLDAQREARSLYQEPSP